jgi:hypothetical protein
LDKFNFNESSSPLNSLYTNLFGIYLIIIFLLCIILNSILLFVFYRNKELRIPFNILIMVITFLNLLSTIQFPFVIHSNFSHKWTSFKYGCIFSAFIMVLLICYLFLLIRIIYIYLYITYI